MKTTYIIVIVTLALGVSCKKEAEDVQANLSASLLLHLNNSIGQDLLNPDLPGHIHYDNIHIYDIVDGTKVRRFVVNYDSPKGISIRKYQSDDRFTLGVRLGHHVGHEEISTTIIEYDDYWADTIDARVYKPSLSSTYINEDIWINGVKIDRETLLEGPVLLVKE